MRNTPHLNDEHMQLYEWSGTGIAFSLPARSKRSHPWHASHAVLGVLTSLLILNGCDNRGAAERSGERVDRSVQETQEEANALFDDATAGRAHETGKALDDAREQTGEKIK